MNEIAKRLNAYITAHPFDSGDSDCETVLDQLYQAYADPARIRPTGDPQRLQRIGCPQAAYPWMITMPSSTSAAASAAPTNTKPSSMVSNTVQI